MSVLYKILSPYPLGVKIRVSSAVQTYFISQNSLEVPTSIFQKHTSIHKGVAVLKYWQVHFEMFPPILPIEVASFTVFSFSINPPNNGVGINLNQWSKFPSSRNRGL
jgi:hypothetical protein